MGKRSRGDYAEVGNELEVENTNNVGMDQGVLVGWAVEYIFD